MTQENEKVLNEGSADEVVIVEKPKKFGKLREKIANVPAKAKYIAAGVAGAATVVVGSAIAATRAKDRKLENEGYDMCVEAALEIDPSALEVEVNPD